MTKKKLCGFSIGLRFLVLEFPRGIGQICGISRGESLFSKGEIQIYKFKGFFSEMYIHNSSPTSLPRSDLGT